MQPATAYSNADRPLPAIRVLMVTGRADFGGGPEHVYQLARSISRSAAVYIACPRDEPYWSRYESIVGAHRMLEIPHRRLALGAFVSLFRFVRAHGINVIHAHGRTGGVYARPIATLAGVPCFYTPNGSTPVTNVKTCFYALVEYLLSTVTRGVIAVSGTEAEALRPICVSPQRLHVIQNGVEIPSRLDTPDGRLNGPLRVVHVTRYVFQKNTELLIEIIDSLRKMGHINSFEFQLLGDGPGRAAFQAGITARGLDPWVKVLGAVTNPGAYMANAFCLVSTSRWEGLPIALLEAMARGVPSIATGVTGNKDAVTDHVTGYLYDADAPHVAAQRLVELAHCPVLWKQMVHDSRQRAEQEFSVEAMAHATIGLYARPLRGAGTAAFPVQNSPTGAVRIPNPI